MRNRSSIYLVPILALFFVFASVDSVYAVAGLRVKSDIEGAELFLNGKSMGYCPPGKFTPEAGRYKLELRKDLADKSYYYYKTDITLKDGEIQTVEAQLKCVPNIEAQMVLVKGRCYQMGSNDGESDEKPVHEVCVSDFYIGRYEVTQGQWKKVMDGKNPSYFKGCGEDCPVEQVSWEDAQGFIEELNRLTGKKYRLPTEAEWEYAARSGGKEEKYAGTSDESRVGEYAWCGKNADNKTHKVGTRNPNGLGIYDMSGNVWEWCSDWYGADYYKNSPKDNPPGPEGGSYRVYRGGSWRGTAENLRASYRDGRTPALRRFNLGFRLARTP